MNCEQRLAEWLETHPDDWKTLTLREIAVQTNMSQSSVDNNLYVAVARKEKMLPSEVHRIRADHRPGRFYRDTDADVQKVIDENPGMPVIDIAYLANCAPQKVERLQKKENTRE